MTILKFVVYNAICCHGFAWEGHAREQSQFEGRKLRICVRRPERCWRPVWKVEVEKIASHHMWVGGKLPEKKSKNQLKQAKIIKKNDQN